MDKISLFVLFALIGLISTVGFLAIVRKPETPKPTELYLSLPEDLQVSGYVWANANKTYMTISNDGVLTFGDDVTPKEAARELAKWFNEFVKGNVGVYGVASESDVEPRDCTEMLKRFKEGDNE